MEKIDNLKLSNELFIVKFDNLNSKYDYFINNLNVKVINITDPEIIEFYDIDVLPTLIFYKNKTIIDKISGFYPKTTIMSKLINL